MKPIESVPQFLRTIFSLQGPEGLRCYRGEANDGWELKPSVMRNLRLNAEASIISELMLEAPGEFLSDTSMFQKLVRAQHYSLPTRLLDVSLNPLVALFFACEDPSERRKDGCVVVLDFPRDRVKFADSDTVSILSNLAKLSDEERSNLVRRRDEIALKGGRRTWTEQRKKAFRSEPEIERLLQFVRSEKPYFLNMVEPSDLAKYFFVHPPKNNSRVIAQSGAFVIAGLTSYDNTARTSSFDIKRLPISKESKTDIIVQLDKININSRTMFPEIEYTSKYIKKKWERSKQSQTGGTSRKKRVS